MKSIGISFILDIKIETFAQSNSQQQKINTILNQIIRQIVLNSLQDSTLKFSLYICLPIGAFQISSFEIDSIHLQRFNFKQFKNKIYKRLLKLVNWIQQGTSSKQEAQNVAFIKTLERMDKSSLITGLTKSLCYINNKMISRQNKIILISLFEDEQIIQSDALIQLSFSAIKDNISINCMSMGQSKKKSTILSQIAYTTNGNYYHCNESNELRKIFDFILTPSHETQTIFNQVSDPSQIDMRAKCRCCNDLIEYGFTCANCFSMICPKTQGLYESKCRFCGIRFKIQQK